MDPLSVCRRDNTLGTQNHAIGTFIAQAVQLIRKNTTAEFFLNNAIRELKKTI